jgi:hypothetical protein
MPDAAQDQGGSRQQVRARDRLGEVGRLSAVVEAREHGSSAVLRRGQLDQQRGALLRGQTSSLRCG